MVPGAQSFWLLEGVFVTRAQSASKEERGVQHDNRPGTKISLMVMEEAVEAEESPCTPKAL